MKACYRNVNITLGSSRVLYGFLRVSLVRYLSSLLTREKKYIFFQDLLHRQIIILWQLTAQGRWRLCKF